MHRVQRKERTGELCLDHLGCGLPAQLAAYLSSTVQVFGAGHTSCLCCSSQQTSLLVVVCKLIVGGDFVGVHSSQ